MLEGTGEMVTSDHISLRVLTASVGGHTFFTLFHDKPKVLNIAYKKIVEHNFQVDND